MENAIRFILGNFTLTFLAIGFLATAISLLRAPKPLTAPMIVEALFFYFLLLSVGFSFLYNFVIHTFFGAVAARMIGWADGPFQAEVGFATRSSAFWRAGVASICASRRLSVRPCSCGAPLAATSIRW